MIDANGSRFDLLLGRADWERCRLDDGSPSPRTLASLWGDPSLDESTPLRFDERDSHVILAPQASRFHAAADDAPPQGTMRRGAAADANGNVYAIVDGGARIEVRSAGSGRLSTFWPSAEHTAALPPLGDFAPAPPHAGLTPPEARLLSGLAVLKGQHLVAGFAPNSSPTSGLLVFDLLAGGPPLELSWPSPWVMSPIDMAPRPCGGLAVLDQHHRVWLLNRQLGMVAVDPVMAAHTAHPADFGPHPTAALPPDEAAPPPASPEPWFPLAPQDLGGGQAVAIEVMPDGAVVVLVDAAADGFARICLYDRGQRRGQASTKVLRDVFSPQERDSVKLRGFDFAWHATPAGTADQPVPRLVVLSDEGNQAFIFEVRRQANALKLTALPDFLPLRRFNGMRLASLGAARAEGDTGLLYRSQDSQQDRWLPLVCQRRLKHVLGASLITPAFDAREAACVWHRVMLDAQVPRGCRLRVASRCSDDPAVLADLPFVDEPDPVLRPDGSELPWLLNAPGSVTDGARGLGTWELLLQACQGQWLQLRVSLEGNELSTPRLGALRAWRPRFSYLQRYLPAVYREDAASADFLERFLALFEGGFTTLEDRIASASALFDVRSAPADTLDWLASWLGLVLDPSLNEVRRRQLIRHAVPLFQYRGTPQAIRLATQLTLSPEVADEEFALPASPQQAPRDPRWHVRVVESYQTRQLPPELLGETPVNDAPRLLQQQGARWSVQEGAAGLQQRWQAWVQAQGGAVSAPPFAPLPPAGLPVSVWQGFCETTLGSVPQLARELQAAWLTHVDSGQAKGLGPSLPQRWPEGSSEAARQQQQAWRTFIGQLSPRLARSLKRWQGFLARRHLRIGNLRASTGANWPEFALVPPPIAVPTETVPLADWTAFETRVVPIGERAHSFSVLVPVSGPESDLDELNRQLDLARRVIELEKPAHTRFDVRPYWAMFRVGQVRLGLDTLLGDQVNKAALAPPLVLGEGHIGASRTALRREVPPDRILLEC